MAEPWLSIVEKLTEFFSTDQIEASAWRTKFVQRTSKITGKLFLALVMFGRWSTPKTTVAQLAAKAAHLDVPVDITTTWRDSSPSPWNPVEKCTFPCGRGRARHATDRRSTSNDS